MTATRHIIPAMGLCLVLTGCDFLIARDRGDDAPAAEKEAPPPLETETASPPNLPEHPVAVASTATIDWEAARADMAATSSEDRDTGFQVAAEGNAPPVPVLLPTGIVIPQGAESGVQFQTMSDGYFATYPGIDYDIIVNGTNEIIGARESGAVSEDSVLTFIPTMTGAQVSFSRYGADYLVEFECKTIEHGNATCISEEEALDLTQRLVIAGTR